MRDDIIRVAREAGFFVGPTRDGPDDVLGIGENLERFYNLAVQHEREECAKLCDSVQDCGPENGCCPTYWNESLDIAASKIRARGEKQ